MKRFQFKRSDKETTTMFRVPNNKAGRRFLDQMKWYSTVGTRVSARGRGPRAIHSREKHPNGYGRAYDQSIPIELAKTLAVYVKKQGFSLKREDEIRAMWKENYHLALQVQEVDQLRSEVQRVTRDRHELMQQRDAVRRQRDEYREQRDRLAVELEKSIVNAETLLKEYRRLKDETERRPVARGSVININHLTVIAGNA